MLKEVEELGESVGDSTVFQVVADFDLWVGFVDKRFEEGKEGGLTRLFERFKGLGTDFPDGAAEGVGEDFTLFEGVGDAEELDDKVDDGVVASIEGVDKEGEVVLGDLFLNLMGVVEIEVGALDFGADNGDEVATEKFEVKFA